MRRVWHYHPMDVVVVITAPGGHSYGDATSSVDLCSLPRTTALVLLWTVSHQANGCQIIEKWNVQPADINNKKMFRYQTICGGWCMIRGSCSVIRAIYFKFHLVPAVRHRVIFMARATISVARATTQGMKSFLSTEHQEVMEHWHNIEDTWGTKFFIQSGHLWRMVHWCDTQGHKDNIFFYCKKIKGTQSIYPTFQKAQREQTFLLTEHQYWMEYWDKTQHINGNKTFIQLGHH